MARLGRGQGNRAKQERHIGDTIMENQNAAGYRDEDEQLNIAGMEAKAAGRSFTTFKLKEGPNIYRILPPFGTNNNGFPYAEHYIHWGFKDSQGKIKPLLCSKKLERSCPICDESNRLNAEKDKLIAAYAVPSPDGKGPKINWKVVP